MGFIFFVFEQVMGQSHSNTGKAGPAQPPGLVPCAGQEVGSQDGHMGVHLAVPKSPAVLPGEHSWQIQVQSQLYFSHVVPCVPSLSYRHSLLSRRNGKSPGLVSDTWSATRRAEAGRV